MEPKNAIEQAMIDLINAAAAEAKQYVAGYPRELDPDTRPAMEASQFAYVISQALVRIKNMADVQVHNVLAGDPVSPEEWL